MRSVGRAVLLQLVLVVVAHEVGQVEFLLELLAVLAVPRVRRRQRGQLAALELRRFLARHRAEEARDDHPDLVAEVRAVRVDHGLRVTADPATRTPG